MEHLLGNKTTTVRLPDSDYGALEILARAEGVSVSAVLREAISAYIQGKVEDGSIHTAVEAEREALTRQIEKIDNFAVSLEVGQ